MPLNVKNFKLHISYFHETTKITVMREDAYVIASCLILFSVQKNTDSITTSIESMQILVTLCGLCGQLVKKIKECIVQEIEAASIRFGVGESPRRCRNVSVMVGIYFAALLPVMSKGF